MSSNVKNIRTIGGTIGPGPAAYMLPTSVGYNYEGNKKVERQIPKMYSFGIRTALHYNTIGPGPAPGGAGNKGEPDVSRITRYGNPTSYKYSFGLRPEMRDREKRPCPYDNQPDIYKTRQFGPQFSFGTRHKDLRRMMAPAPNAYFTSDKDGVLQNIMDTVKTRAPRFTLNSRLKDLSKQRSPGPAVYHPYIIDQGSGKMVDREDPVRPRGPQYSMAGRHPVSDRTVGPGPMGYDIRAVNAIKAKDNLHPTAVDGKRAPAWVFGQRGVNAPLIIPEDSCLSR